MKRKVCIYVKKENFSVTILKYTCRLSREFGFLRFTENEFREKKIFEKNGWGG